MDIQGAASALSGIPLGWILAAVFFVIVAADALRAGSAHASSFALSMPITMYLFKLVPQTIIIGSLLAAFSGTWPQAILFVVIEAVLFVCLSQMFFSYDHYTSLFSSAICGLAATVVLLVVWVQMPELSALYNFGPQVAFVFGAAYSFFWLFLSYFALAFAGS